LSESPIAERFRAVRGAGRAALIPYLTAGFPSASATAQALAMLVESGADVVELGVPFSDPLADGPVIQRASELALAGGMSLAGVLRLVADGSPAVPVVLFSYLNPLLAYGFDTFVRDARAAGVAGILITDLPAGEDPGLLAAVGAQGLDLIRLVAPTTTAARARAIVADATGFVYAIARLGVTGAETELSRATEDVVRRIRAATPLPVAVGFGIRKAEQARAIARYADGVVVGSALLERLAGGIEPARALINELRGGLERF
jgi:tryptophan synthase alpha chain